MKKTSRMAVKVKIREWINASNDEEYVAMLGKVI